MARVYKDTIGIFFLVNALLIPIIVLSQNVLISGAFALLFIVSNAMTILLFLARDEPAFHEWYTLWAVIIGAAYLFLVMMGGRGLGIETIGFLLVLAYIVSALIFLINLPRKETEVADEETVDSELSDEEMADFRNKDELEALLDSFQVPEAPKQKHLNEYEDFRRDKINRWDNESLTVKTADNVSGKTADGYYEIKAPELYGEADTENHGYIELYPETPIKPLPRIIPKRPDSGNKVQVVEIKEAPKLDVTILRASTQTVQNGMTQLSEKTKLIAEKAALEDAEKRLQQMVDEQRAAKWDVTTIKPEDGLRTINEKIRLIAEKAILEGAEKKLKKMVVERAMKEDDEGQLVYASITGDKYHHMRSCMSLRRVRKRDIVIYENSKDAKKKGLRACGLCNK